MIKLIIFFGPSVLVLCFTAITLINILVFKDIKTVELLDDIGGRIYEDRHTPFMVLVTIFYMFIFPVISHMIICFILIALFVGYIEEVTKEIRKRGE